MPDLLSTEYINSTDYKTIEQKLRDLWLTLDDLDVKTAKSRALRYSEVNIEAQRAAGKLQPDELFVPQHIIDTNIRREQSPYVQYITQSPRAVILEDLDDDAFDLSLLEKDLTKKLRYDGWQLEQFGNIDGFQSHGYSVIEVVQDLTKVGEVAHEMVQFCDFVFSADTRNLQNVEYCGRKYYFSKTQLLGLCASQENPWNRTQVDKVIKRQPDSDAKEEIYDVRDKSLYPVVKVMFRVNGIVQVGWCRPEVCDDWLREPKPLDLGRKRMIPDPNWQPPVAPSMPMVGGNLIAPNGVQSALPVAQAPLIPVPDYETEFPYVLYPYLISENDTIAQLKGRIFLDQDLQEAVTSLMSSTVTQARRAAGLYFSKDVADPNDELLMQKNVYFEQGAIINAKIQSFKLDAPDPGIFSAINALTVANQSETSQVNFAVNNRKDSRKTAKEVETAEKQQAILSTVQVVLFSIALTQTYRKMVSIIKSRVLAGLIKVNPTLQTLYARNFSVKPSGDVDVIERQQLIQSMINAWPIIQNTPAGPVFLIDLIELMFPTRAAKYVQAIQAGLQQQQAMAQQQQSGVMQVLGNIAQGIIKLSESPDMFSDVGKVHALPAVKMAADKLIEIQGQK